MLFLIILWLMGDTSGRGQGCVWMCMCVWLYVLYGTGVEPAGGMGGETRLATIHFQQTKNEIIYEQYNINIKVKRIHSEKLNISKGEKRGTMRFEKSYKRWKNYYYQLIISLKRTLNELTYSKRRLLDIWEHWMTKDLANIKRFQPRILQTCRRDGKWDQTGFFSQGKAGEQSVASFEVTY